MAIGPDLWPRVGSAAVLAPLALLLTWYGGAPFAAMWGAAALAVLWEWWSLTRRMAPMGKGRATPSSYAALLAPGAAITGAVLAAYLHAVPAAAVFTFAAMAIAAVLTSGGRGWAAAGALYASAMALPAILLRQDADYGLTALFWLFALVWTTDVAAYFTGRLLGGPKLWPRMSPNKTWSGAIGGTLGGTMAGLAVLSLAGIGNLIVPTLLTLLASIASQSGDLFESHLKRRCGAKDASRLIPGHGGVMDRLDGFVAAAAFALLVGLLRDGAIPARGLLLW